MPGRDSRLSQTIQIPVRNCGWARRNAGSIAKTAKSGTHIDIRHREENKQVNGQWMATVVVTSWRSDAIAYAIQKLQAGDPEKTKRPTRPAVRRTEPRVVSFSALSVESDEEEEEPQQSDAEKLAAAEKAAGLVPKKETKASQQDSALEKGWETVALKTTKTTKTKKKTKKGKNSYTIVGGGGIAAAKENDESRMKGILDLYRANKEKYDAMADARLKDGSWRPKNKGQKPEGLYSCFYEWADKGGVRYGQLKYFSRNYKGSTSSHEKKTVQAAETKFDMVSGSFPTLGNKPVPKTSVVLWGVTPMKKQESVEKKPVLDSWEDDDTNGMVFLGVSATSTPQPPSAPEVPSFSPLKRTMSCMPLNTTGQFHDESAFVDDEEDWETQWDNGMVGQTA